MIIATQTAYGFALLLISSLVSGIILSALYLVLAVVPAIASSGRTVRDGYKSFRERVKCYVSNKYFTTALDFLIFIIAACTVCSLVFVFNGGQFRIIPVAALCMGFFCGKYLFTGLLNSFVTVFAYFLMKALFFVSFPIVCLIGCFGNLIRRIIAKAVIRHKLSLMKKYTKRQLDKLEAFTEFGLVDQYYKDLIK